MTTSIDNQKLIEEYHHSILIDKDDEYSTLLDPSKIIDYLWVGSFDNSTNPTVLEQYGIRRILNVSNASKLPTTIKTLNALHIVHDEVVVENDSQINLSTVFIKTYKLISDAVGKNITILVHCQQGIGTSIAVLAYYFLREMYAYKDPPKENALPLIIKGLMMKRKVIELNDGFIEQLEDEEANMSGRPVNSMTSMSIRRNVALKQKLNKMMADDLAKDITKANKTWKTVHNVRI